MYQDPEYRERLTGKNNPMYGRSHTEEARAKMSAAWTPERKAKLSAAWTGKTLTEETKAKISAALTGENAPNWKGGISFEPYCPMFNNKIKEAIRNKWNRSCAHCGKSEILNGARLTVHHVDSDKMAGCNGKKWKLIALCRSCHHKLHNHERFECLVLVNLEVR